MRKKPTKFDRMQKNPSELENPKIIRKNIRESGRMQDSMRESDRIPIETERIQKNPYKSEKI